VESLLARAVEAEGGRDANAAALEEAATNHGQEMAALQAKHAEELKAALQKAQVRLTSLMLPSPPQSLSHS
jgi:hypothetical protein